MQRTSKKESKSGIEKEVKERVNTPKEKKAEYEGNTEFMISTGSTLLDLAISGGRVRGGGIPGGILVEVFGPESSGKTVLLCETAGDVQRKGGAVQFQDTEARLNEQFAQMFDFDTESIEITSPDTVTEVFEDLRKWIPDNGMVNGSFTDSLAALSTRLELDEDDGDKMGMRRAKEFSEQLRKTCRILANTNTLLMCSNQVRENVDRGTFGTKWKAPGGKGIAFYSSLRLRTNIIGNLTRERSFKGNKIKQVYGVLIEVDVVKSSVWKPKRKAQIAIDYDYGVDDIRENLDFIKKTMKYTTYKLGDTDLGKARDGAIALIEKNKWQNKLREEVIDLWEEIDALFKVERERKQR
jgi:recombination protein RecA